MAEEDLSVGDLATPPETLTLPHQERTPITLVVCETCGAPAVVVVVDVREVEPMLATDGPYAGCLFETWEVDGPPHHYCQAHARPRLAARLPGSPSE